MNDLTDPIYWAHQPAPVRDAVGPRKPGQPALTDADRVNAVQRLLGQGYVVDGPIMLWGWGPRNVMYMRLLYGQTSVQALGEDTTPAQTGHLTGGSIRVSLDAADYPPVD